MKLKDIQDYLNASKAEAWLLVDYENRNPALVSLLGDKMLTRKILLLIPACGKPTIIAHEIDSVFLKDAGIRASFDLKIYRCWQQMLEIEASLLKPYKQIMMDVSENGLLPRVSLADWGSVNYVLSLGVKVISSADLLQNLTAVYSERAYELQLKACELTLAIKDEAFAKIKEDILSKGSSDEFDVQQFICDRFHEEGMVYDDPPIVAIGPNASNPHYGPTETEHSPIHEGDLVLIDMWAKIDDPEGVYADITWMGYVGNKVPKEYEDRFEVVKAARDGVISFLEKEIPLRKVEAWEADDVARRIITDASYGEYFLHRVGHNIAIDVSPHGPGANLDNYESHDFRELLEGTSFSDEPGIYAPDFGMRSETNLHIRNRKLEVVAGLQDKIIPILK